MTDQGNRFTTRFSRDRFRTTHWTIVLDAARPDAAADSDAFAKLYCDYWSPLYAYVRRRGYGRAEAEDITQDFFVCLIEKRRLEGLQREGGKFRHYLLRSLDYYLANVWDRDHAQKRGNGVIPLSLDLTAGDRLIEEDGPDLATPEAAFDREWIVTLLANVLRLLGEECQAAGKGALFEDLYGHLQGELRGTPFAEVAARHGMTEGAVKVAAHRLRQRYGELLRGEIARTVGGPAEVEEELRVLLSIIAT